MTAFLKMHGLGNDFVVFDARNESISLPSARALAIADRRLGVGCDQVIVIEKSVNGADAAMRILNSDGSEVESCGNAARCVARLLMEESGKREIRIDTEGGALACTDIGGLVSVDMGAPKFGWRDIPLAERFDWRDIPGEPLRITLHLCNSENEETEITGAPVSVGNPHFVVFVKNAEITPVYELGSQIERNPLFPKRTNVEFVSSLENDRLRMRVFERGAGVTRACGTGACAAAVIAYARKMAGRKVEVVLDGGSLWIEWRENDNHILMTGPTALVYRGEIDLAGLA